MYNLLMLDWYFTLDFIPHLCSVRIFIMYVKVASLTRVTRRVSQSSGGWFKLLSLFFSLLFSTPTTVSHHLYMLPFLFNSQFVCLFSDQKFYQLALIRPLSLPHNQYFLPSHPLEKLITRKKRQGGRRATAQPAAYVSNPKNNRK